MLRLVGHPVAVNPDAELGRVARAEGWEVLRFERLGRRLRVLGAAGVAAALGGLGSVVLSRRSAPPRRRAHGDPAAAPMSLHELTRSSARSATSRRASPTSGSRRTPPPGTASTRSRASCSASSASSG